MIDKVELLIPLRAEAVRLLTSCSDDGVVRGWVDPIDYDFPVIERFVCVNGMREVTSLQAQRWERISSGLAGMAMGFHTKGNGFYEWPHIVIKASPAKILQGHNVFGSECPKQGIAQMLNYVEAAFPKIFADLDIQSAEVRYIDSTYSARIPEHFSSAIFRMFDKLATQRTKVNSNYLDKGYIQLGKGSDRQRQKVYKKHQEVMDELREAVRLKDETKIKILGDQRLLDWCENLHRFEATTGPRKFADIGIPTRMVEFVKFCDWFLEVHKQPLSQYLWEVAFKPLFGQFEGHTMKNVDDSHIKLKIDAKFMRIKDNGKVCKRKAEAVYRTYRDIKLDGYDRLCSRDNKTFFRNVKHLEEAGISRAFLKSLDPHKPFDNVVPMVQFLKIDFGQQRPDWYEESTAGYSQPGRHLKLVASR